MSGSTNDAVHKALEHMRTVICEHGGYVHPDLTFCVSAEGISAQAPVQLVGEFLVKVPLALLIPAELVSWRLNNGKLITDDKQHVLSPVQQTLLQLFVTIYNAQNLPEWAARHLLATQAPFDNNIADALTAIAPSFRLNPLSPVDALLQTRYLMVNSEKAGDVLAASSGAEGLRVLMPLIDFFNHHPTGASYKVSKAGLSIQASASVSGDGLTQVYALYGGFRDVLMMALTYGYVDDEIQYLYSAPFAWYHKGLGHVQVLRQQVRSNNKFHLPIIEDKDTLSFSHLLMNAQQAGYLTGTVQLAFLKRGLRLGFSRAECMAAAREFMRELLRFNIAKHEQLQLALKTAAVTPAVSQIDAASQRSVELIKRVYTSEQLDVE